MDRGAALLAPCQLGFGVRGGVEAAVHAARRFITNLKPGKLFLKIDFKNAFNTVRRDIILEAVAEYFPELLTFATSTLSDPSDLMFGDFHLSSEEGAQQGDSPWPTILLFGHQTIIGYD